MQLQCINKPHEKGLLLQDWRKPSPLEKGHCIVTQIDFLAFKEKDYSLDLSRRDWITITGTHARVVDGEAK